VAPAPTAPAERHEEALASPAVQRTRFQCGERADEPGLKELCAVLLREHVGRVRDGLV
jgi:hypothetical protein